MRSFTTARRTGVLATCSRSTAHRRITTLAARPGSTALGIAIGIALTVAAASDVAAQTTPAPAGSAASTPAASPHRHDMDMGGMPMGGMDMGDKPMDAMASHAMGSALGGYAMSRDGSGTSWQPEATPMEMLHTVRGDWSLMLHGYANAIEDRQSGPRGDTKAFSESMLMLMADRPLGPGTLGLRSMLSLDPLMGSDGYPLLYQTGETADGKTALVDRQHPHDALMELAGSYSLPLGDDRAAFVYAGLPGEPALGPTTFMHRFSGMRNPEAPITHHWFDSTHITFGVVTAGAIQGPWKLEGSWFNGREPDEHRWNIETRAFDSWSTRLSWNPTTAWSLQTSYGYLKSPEQLEPTTSVRRFTTSASYQAELAGHPWATTLAWSRNDKRGPDGRLLLPATLLESTYIVGRHTFFGRWEQATKDELFLPGQALAGQDFRVRKLSLGYIVDIASSGPLRWGIGGVVGLLDGPSALTPSYGRSPVSTMLFLQARIAP